MKSRPKAFTLAEMLIVMGIIILFLSMALPTIRVMTGSRSVSIAQNELSAVLVHARELAVAQEQYAGVLFFINPANNNRITAAVVQQAAIQDRSNLVVVVGTTTVSVPFILLDAVPDLDSTTLPPGVGLQTVFNGCGTTASQQAGTDDRYMGYNTAAVGAGGILPQIGGCILFDGNGRLVQLPYGLQLYAPLVSSTGVATVQQSGLSVLLGIAFNSSSATGQSVWGSGGITSEIIPASNTSSFPATLVTSQVGMVLFDHDAFIAAGFNDLDADFQNGTQLYTTAWPVSYYSGGQSEQAEEAWLDNNSTPIMVNRYNGTLIRGE